MQDYIIVGFSTPKEFHTFPWIIRKVEKTEFSHVYFKVFSKSLNRYLIYQASGLQVNFVGQDTFYKTNKVIAEFTIPVTPEQKTTFLQKAVDIAGRPYGMKQVLGIGLVRAAAGINVKINNPWADGNHTYVCSELAADFLNDLGFEFEDLDNITPKDIYEKLKD